jgi:hypothetical protein
MLNIGKVVKEKTTNIRPLDNSLNKAVFANDFLFQRKSFIKNEK